MFAFWKKGQTQLNKNPSLISSKQLSALRHMDLSRWINNLSKADFLNRKDEIMELTQIVDAFLELPEARLVEIIDLLEVTDWTKLIGKADIDDSVFFLGYLTEDRLEELLPQLPQHQKLRRYLEYPRDSCGRQMQTDFFSIPIELTAEESLDYIRKHAKNTDYIYYIYCVTSTLKLIGVASLRQLAMAEPQSALDDIINRDVIACRTHDDIEVAINMVQQHDLVAIPVLNENHRMVGLITIDDVVDEIQEQATADIYAQAGLQQMDSVTMKAYLSFLNRIPWLVLNMFLAWFASLVIHQFESTISEVLILASLMNICAATGGNTAIQTLTVVTRGLAIGEFHFTTYKKALIKEITVGVTLGFCTGAVACLVVYGWKQDLTIGLILWLSMFLNSIIAATMGSLVPIILKSLGKDPAVGSGVLVTMGTDIGGYLIFLTIATFGLSYIS
ncbi:MAG: magnesium transporter [Bdellovibrionaceae bacterium]|nr:magnesium transporter [Pseudobdellovibrionaceae bacterium]